MDDSAAAPSETTDNRSGREALEHLCWVTPPPSPPALALQLWFPVKEQQEELRNELAKCGNVEIVTAASGSSTWL